MFMQELKNDNVEFVPIGKVLLIRQMFLYSFFLLITPDQTPYPC